VDKAEWDKSLPFEQCKAINGWKTRQQHWQKILQLLAAEIWEMIIVVHWCQMAEFRAAGPKNGPVKFLAA
jgi:hypothetical protein